MHTACQSQMYSVKQAAKLQSLSTCHLCLQMMQGSGHDKALPHQICPNQGFVCEVYQGKMSTIKAGTYWPCVLGLLLVMTHHHTLRLFLMCMQNMPVLPSSPSTPSAMSCGVDHGFTLVDDSMKGFKLNESLSSSSHSGTRCKSCAAPATCQARPATRHTNALLMTGFSWPVCQKGTVQGD